MAEKKTYEELEERIREMEIHLKGTGNREYKSRLFGFLFGREENKRWTLSLYNSIHGTSYDDISAVTINTIEDVVYMGMKNDLSILVSEIVSLYRSLELYEQQSSYNPNMPVREFMYAGKLYDKFIHSARLNRYGKKLLPLPLPKLVVFYNGTDEKEDECTLSISDAFKEEIRQSRPLGEYTWFVAQVRNNQADCSTGEDDAQTGIGSAIDNAIDEMPEDFEIQKFITANRAEVKDMCLTEYNEAEAMEMLKEEGRQEGLQETMILNIHNLMDSIGCTAEKAMDLLKVPQEQRITLYLNLSK